MEIAKIEVRRTTGACIMKQRIPAGIVGGTVSVTFEDPVWDNLVKTVVFRGKETRVAAFDGTVAVIPYEVVATAGVSLYFGIFGHDPDTDLQIPLIEVRLGTTEGATNVNADPGTDPTLPIWAQLQRDIEQLKQSIGDSEAPGKDGEDGGYYTPEVTQPEEDTIRFEFAASKSDMPAVNPVDVIIPRSGEDIDLTGYATEEFVRDGFQPKGKYLTDAQLDPVIKLANEANQKVETLREVVSKFHSNIVEEANGETIILDDASDMELAGLKVFGKTTQKTTTGKNLLDNREFEPAHFSGTSAFNGYGNGKWNSTNLLTETPVKPGDTITYQALFDATNSVSTSNNVTVWFYGENNVYISSISGNKIYNGQKGISSVTVTIPEEAAIVYCGLNVNTKEGMVVTNAMVEIGSTATEYEPYTGGIPSPSPEFPQPLESVGDGGSVTVNVGFSETDDNPQTLTVQKPADVPILLPGIGDIRDEVDFARGKYVQHIGQIGSYNGENVGDVWMSSTGELSIGATVLYKMDSFIEHDLSAEELAQYAALHTNYPNTTIFNDGGAGMEVKYVADTKLYIDKKFAELAAAWVSGN